MRIGQGFYHRERIELVIGIHCPSCGRRNGHNSWCTWALLQINLNMRAMIAADGGDTTGCDLMIMQLDEIYKIEQRNRRRLRRRLMREAQEEDRSLDYPSLRTEDDLRAIGLKPRFVRLG